MITEVQRLLDDYLKWLKDRTSLRQVGDCVEITTPYLDRHTSSCGVAGAWERRRLACSGRGRGEQELGRRRKDGQARRLRSQDNALPLFTPPSPRHHPVRQALASPDIRQVRPPNCALLNDSDRPVPPGVSDALLNYGVTPLLWGQRDAHREQLAA